MNLRKIAAVAACAGIAAGAAGCGGDGDDSTGGDTDITKAEWIEQADAICEAGDDAIDEAGLDSGLDENATEDELQAFVTDTLIPNVADQAEQIEALPVPAGEEEAIGSLTDALNQAVSEAEADPEGVTSGTTSAFDDVNQQAQDYGLTSCGDA